MKKLLLLLLTFSLCATTLFAQKIEYGFFGSAGVAHYTGSYPANLSYFDRQSFVNNPYASKQTFTYLTSFGGQAQVIFKEHFIIGVQLGLENVRTTIKVDHREDRIDPNFTIDATSTLHTRFVAFSPYIGYRLTTGNIKVDILPGADIAIKTKGSVELKMNTNDQGTLVLGDYKLEDIPVDVRARIGVTAYYNRFGLSANYSRGLSNYVKNNPKAAGKDAYSEIIRFGIVYRIF